MLFSHTGLLASVPWLTEGVRVSWETRRHSCSHKNRNASTEKQSEQFFTVTGRVSTLSVYLILPAPHCWCLYEIPTHVVKLVLWVSPAEKIIIFFGFVFNYLSQMWTQDSVGALDSFPEVPWKYLRSEILFDSKWWWTDSTSHLLWIQTLQQQNLIYALKSSCA